MAGTGTLPKILVSACLLGDIVRYDARAKACHHPLLRQWQKAGQLVKICPEVAAGLPTPRPAAEIERGDGYQVLDRKAHAKLKNGSDISAFFIQGAAISLRVVQQTNIKFALLKANSPSCGNEAIYNGRFEGRLHPGAGVTAAQLMRHGIRVFNENQIEALSQALGQFEQQHTKNT